MAQEHELLFRGKSIRTNTWMYGSVVINKAVKKAYICWMSKSNSMHIEEVYLDSIGQYVNIKDKHGMKMFTGDICSYYNSEDKDGIALLEEDYASWYKGTIRQRHIMTPLFYLHCSKEWEVIGNVTDNPEIIGVNDDD